MLAQSSAKEYSAQGVHVVHAIANGLIEDADGEKQKSGKAMSAEAVGKTYLWLGSGADALGAQIGFETCAGENLTNMLEDPP